MGISRASSRLRHDEPSPIQRRNRRDGRGGHGVDRDELRARRRQYDLPAVLAKEGEESSRARAIELTRHIVEQENGPHPARRGDDLDLRELQRKDHRAMLPLRSDAANRAPVDRERQIIAVGPTVAPPRRRSAGRRSESFARYASSVAGAPGS